MAIRHGLAGRYGKAQAAKRYKRFLYLLTIASPIAFTVYGFVWGYFWYRTGPLFAVAPLLAVAGLMWLAWRWLLPYLESTAKERLQYMRGGQAEGLIAWVLEDLDDNWHVFNGIKLESGSDIDHVVVGPAGLYCVSTKSHRGTFTGTVDGLLHNGKPSPFAKQAMGQTMALKDRLTAMMGSNIPWITSILALPFGYTYSDACGGAVWLVHQDNIVDRLAPEDAPKKLSKQQIARIAKVLELMQEGAAEVYQRPIAEAAPVR